MMCTTSLARESGDVAPLEHAAAAEGVTFRVPLAGLVDVSRSARRLRSGAAIELSVKLD
jgi:hypothetical protein